MRVVYVVDNPHRRRFAYGTLPGTSTRANDSDCAFDPLMMRRSYAQSCTPMPVPREDNLGSPLEAVVTGTEERLRRRVL